MNTEKDILNKIKKLIKDEQCKNLFESLVVTILFNTKLIKKIMNESEKEKKEKLKSSYMGALEVLLNYMKYNQEMLLTEKE